MKTDQYQPFCSPSPEGRQQPVPLGSHCAEFPSEPPARPCPCAEPFFPCTALTFPWPQPNYTPLVHLSLMRHSVQIGLHVLSGVGAQVGRRQELYLLPFRADTLGL